MQNIRIDIEDFADLNEFIAMILFILVWQARLSISNIRANLIAKNLSLVYLRF